MSTDELYRAANRIERSLIRIEADELTYNLHILIRFELELELFDGALALADLPEAWNARYRDYLGLEVPDDARGVLQDVHWAGGAFGYFPTYSLGNVIAGQLWEAAERDVAGSTDRIAAGDLAPLGEWLREHVHRHGRRLSRRRCSNARGAARSQWSRCSTTCAARPGSRPGALEPGRVPAPAAEEGSGARRAALGSCPQLGQLSRPRRRRGPGTARTPGASRPAGAAGAPERCEHIQRFDHELPGASGLNPQNPGGELRSRLRGIW